MVKVLAILSLLALSLWLGYWSGQHYFRRKLHHIRKEPFKW